MALEHKHVIIRAEVLNPPNEEEQASNQVKDLIEQIGMKILMGPYAKYCTMVGNRGLTVAAIIETSHVVMHVWDENAPALIQLDVYTCGPFNKNIVVNKTKILRILPLKFFLRLLNLWKHKYNNSVHYEYIKYNL